MAKAYVKFETPKDISAKALEAISVASSTGKVRKGANEATKAIEGGNALLIVMAEDVDPEEVLMHIPTICGQKGVPYCYVATKKELGTAAGLPVPTSAVAIEKAGNAGEMVNSIAEKARALSGVAAASAAHAAQKKEHKPEAKAEEKKEHKPAEHKPEEKKEHKKEPKPKKEKEAKA